MYNFVEHALNSPPRRAVAGVSFGSQRTQSSSCWLS